MNLLKTDTITAINGLVDEWNTKMVTFESKEEVRQNTNRVFTMFVNLVKPMMTAELAEQFTANPLTFLATGDQAVAAEAWTMVRDDCNKQMVEMKAFFDKKFDDSMKALDKHHTIAAIQAKQRSMDDKLLETSEKLDEVASTALATQDVTQKIVEELDQEAQRRESTPSKAGPGMLNQVLTDLVTTIATGAEGQIGRIRVLVMYLASTTTKHAEEAGMSVSTWSECVGDALTQFRHSQEKRLRRDEIMGIARRLSLPNEINALYDNLKAIVGDSEYESRNYDAFKFQTWARCTRHRSTNQEEKESVKRKKASKWD